MNLNYLWYHNKENTSLNLPFVRSCRDPVGQNVLPLKPSKLISNDSSRQCSWFAMCTSSLIHRGHLKNARLITSGPSQIQEPGRDSCLRAVLCYKRFWSSLRKHPFLLALRLWGRFARRNAKRSRWRRARRNGCFCRLVLKRFRRVRAILV